MALSSRARRACLHAGATLAVLTVALMLPLLPRFTAGGGFITLGLFPARVVTSVAALLTAAGAAFAAPFAIAWVASTLSAPTRGR